MQVNFTQTSCVEVSNLTRFVGLGLLLFLCLGCFVGGGFLPRDITSVQQEHKLRLY